MRRERRRRARSNCAGRLRRAGAGHRAGAAAAVLLAGCSAGGGPATEASLTPVAGSAESTAASVSSSPVDTACNRASGPGTISIAVESRLLGRPVRVTIISAVAHASVTSVLYLLHGANTDETQWTAIGVQAALDRLATEGRPPTMALALADLPSPDAGVSDAAVFVQEVVPAVEGCFGGLREPARRAVGGISRGGQLALSVAAAHGQLFAAVGGHSPVVPPGEVPALADRLSASGIRVWLDVGESDGLRPAVLQLASALSGLGSPPALQVRPGGHDRAYWRSHIEEYLRFYAQVIGA